MAKATAEAQHDFDAGQQVVVILERAVVHPDEDQPREEFDEAKLLELEQSIAVRGIVQPLIVRVHPKRPGEFLLVAGERRHIAAGRVGLQELPCIIKRLTPRGALEHQLTENLDRADMTPLEEGNGFRRLMEQHQVAAEEIADTFHRPVAYIVRRISLTWLSDETKERLRTKKISVGAAEAIARVPQRFHDKILSEVTYGDGEVAPVRDVEYHIAEKYRLRLAEAPFDLRDAKLCPDAGACVDCDKRTANDHNLFDDIAKDDFCTDRDCHELKLLTWWDAQCKKAEARGQKVLDDAEAQGIIRYGKVEPRARYVNVDDVCYDDKRKRTWRKLLGDDVPIVLARAGSRVFELVARKHLPDAAPAPVNGGSGSGVKVVSTKEARKQEKESRSRAGAAVLVIVQHVNAGLELGNGHTQWDALHSLIARGLARLVNWDTLRDVCTRRGLVPRNMDSPGERRDLLDESISAMTLPQRVALALELVLHQAMPGGIRDPLIADAMRAFDLNPDDLVVKE